MPIRAPEPRLLSAPLLRAADEQVDYTLYDTDGNRQVDMVYFIFSGGGSNHSGNDATLLWPHASTVMNLSLDGVSFGRYACSTELYGAPANKRSMVSARYAMSSAMCSVCPTSTMSTTRPAARRFIRSGGR